MVLLMGGTRAALIPGATKIEEMKDAPGGGHIVTLTDTEGFPINIIYGQGQAPARQRPENLLVNTETEKPRVRKFQRFDPGPAAVHKVRFPRFFLRTRILKS